MKLSETRSASDSVALLLVEDAKMFTTNFCILSHKDALKSALRLWSGEALEEKQNPDDSN